MINKKKTLTDEIASQASLHPDSGTTAGAEPIHLSSVMNTFMALSKEKQTEFFKAMLDTVASWKSDGAGVVGSTSAMNLKSVKSGNAPQERIHRMIDRYIYPENFAIVQDLDPLLEQVNLPDDLKQKATELFLEAAALRETTFKNNLKDLLNAYGACIVDPEQIDVVEELLQRRKVLEENIEYVESKSERLKRRLMDHWLNDDLTNEEVLYGRETAISEPRTPKQSTVDYYLNEPQNETADWATEKRVAGPMRPYLESLDRTSWNKE